MQHSVWNLYSVIQNGLISRRQSVFHPKNSLCLQILRVLYKEGYILGFRNKPNNPDVLEVFLKYSNGNPVVKKIQPLSKPGRRFYVTVKTLWKVETSLSTLILSTSKGVLSDKDCRKYNQGGELLCIIN